MEHRGGEGGGEAYCRQRFPDAFPERHGRADAGVFRQSVVELRLIGVMQHIHHMGAANACRIVQAGIFKAARFKIGDALRRQLLHLLFAAEVNRAGRTGFDAGRFLSDIDSIDAERALIGAVVLLADARHVERASRNAVAAADAVVRLKVDDTVSVLHDGARRRAGFQTAGIGAVHTAILADQPFQSAILLNLREAHHRPGFGVEIGRIVVNADIVPNLGANIVPLRAGDLTAFTADTGGNVDQLGDLLPVIARLRRGRERAGRGATNNVLCGVSHVRSPLRLFHFH